jgi:hypothetical protein
VTTDSLNRDLFAGERDRRSSSAICCWIEELTTIALNLIIISGIYGHSYVHRGKSRGLLKSCKKMCETLSLVVLMLVKYCSH